MGPTTAYDASQSLQNVSKKHEERESYTPVHINLQFAVIFAQ